jgi:transketolase C-terminal domain/subunit
MRKTFIQAVLDYSMNNPVPYLITGDLGYSVLEEFQIAHSDKFINVGILEQSMISMSAGISSQDKKVFAYSISNFSTFRALEQIRLDVAYHNLDVCVVGVGTGFQYGSAGYSHWAIEDLSAVSGIEKLRIFSPADPESMRNVVLDFLHKGGPTYLRVGKQSSNLKDIMDYKNIEKHVRVFGEGHNLFLSHGSIAFEILNSKKFDAKSHSLLVFDEIPNKINKNFFDIFAGAESIKILEDVVFPGSLGSRAARFLVENRLNNKFDWIGVDGKNIKTAGGSEEFLKSRELGLNYIENLF